MALLPTNLSLFLYLNTICYTGGQKLNIGAMWSPIKITPELLLLLRPLGHLGTYLAWTSCVTIQRALTSIQLHVTHTGSAQFKRLTQPPKEPKALFLPHHSPPTKVSRLSSKTLPWTMGLKGPGREKEYLSLW